MRKQIIAIIIFAAIAAALLFLLWPPAADKPAQTEQDVLARLGYHVTEGAAAGYIEDRACATCHAGIAETYKQVGMSQSFARPRAEVYIEDFENNHFYHAKSREHYEMIRRGEDIYFKRYQLDEHEQPINVYELKVDWILGSGHKTRSYLAQTELGEMFQLPIGWYSETRSWGMSPGFDNATHFGVTRKVLRECMFCHNAFPEVAEGSDRRGQAHLFPKQLPEGTGCQRCHGPGAEHARLALSGARDVQQLRGAIINPGKLEPARRDDICFGCHMLPAVALIGVRRFDRPVYSFRPGDVLADYALVLDVEEEHQTRNERFEINHHPYRLMQSRCYTQSEGKMSCLSCHNPHRKIPPAQQAAHYRDACLKCHQTHEPRPVLSGPGEGAAPDNCVACHMQQRRTQDVIQTTMTDHFIRRIPGGAELLAPREEHTPVLLDAQYLFPESAPKGLQGTIYRAVAVTRAGSTRDSISYLEKTLREHPQDSLEPYLDLAKAQLDHGMSDRAEITVRTVLERAPDDNQAREYLAAIHLQRKEYAQAETILRALLKTDPNNPTVPYHLGLIQLAGAKYADAMPFFDTATRMRPNMDRAWFYLGYASGKTGEYKAANTYYRQALAISPRYTRAYIFLAKSLLAGGDQAEARRYARHGLSHAEQPAQIRTELAELL